MDTGKRVSYTEPSNVRIQEMLSMKLSVCSLSHEIVDVGNPRSLPFCHDN